MRSIERVSGVSGSASAITRARLAMFLARSPQRSRLHADLQRRDGAAQVVGHRLAQGDQADGLPLDVGLAASSSRASRAITAWASGDVAAGDGADRVGDLGLGQAAHARELGGDGVELFVVGPDGVFHDCSRSLRLAEARS